MSGLQRRHVKQQDGGGSSSPVTETTSSPRRVTPVGVDQDHHRVAYDPQDLDQDAGETKQPRLTLMEEVLLLGLKDTQGYLSFWNDNISYALRGCIIMELAFRGKVSMVGDVSRRRLPLSDRVLSVVDDKITGEPLLDEALKIMKLSEPLSVANWIDYLSGETWNLTKINYQLKQVRERLAKGLVDKGVLRTEKKNFFLFDMATHPVADTHAKDELKRRVATLLTARTVALPKTAYFADDIPYRCLRSVALVAGAYAATVLENVLTNLSYEARDQAFNRADELLTDYSDWPFAVRANATIGANLPAEIAREIEQAPGTTSQKELHLEVIAAVLSVYGKLDSIL